MSARGRVVAIVAAAAAAAAAVAAGVVAVGASGDGREAEREPPRVAPPLLLDLGVRDDPEARALRAAAAAYAAGRRADAGRMFARYRSLPARLGAAMAVWPGDAERRLRALEDTHPRSALVLLHRGVVAAWDDRVPEAARFWRRALRLEPDSLSAIRAEDFLYLRRYAPGRPTFTPSRPLPARVRALPPRRQLEVLEQQARADPTAGLFLGSALQQLGRPVSALAVYRRAADQAVGASKVEADVAVAVASFTKAEPERAFSLLGPLARDHPRTPTVRLHLGLLLAWIGEAENAKRQLRQAVSAGPRTRAGAEARRLLDRLENSGTR